MNRSARRVVAAAILLGSVASVACGGAPMAESSRSAAAAATASTPAASPASESAAQTGAMPATAAGPAAASAFATAPGPAAALFERSATQLDASLSDCRQACRALSSMDRACGSLCALSSGDADPARCSDDTTRLKGARDRVRAACVTCPDGTRVDRDAPVPSAPR